MRRVSFCSIFLRGDDVLLSLLLVEKKNKNFCMTHGEIDEWVVGHTGATSLVCVLNMYH